MVALLAAALSTLALTPPLLRGAPPRVAVPCMSSAAAASTAATSAAAPLAGFDAFRRSNPRSDRFEVLGFHHVELYCSDATCTAGRFAHALGMDVLASSRNDRFASVAIGSGDVKLAFTAPMPAPRV